MEPPSRSDTTNWPTVGINTNTEPATTPGTVKGNIIRQKLRQRPAPKSALASIKVKSKRASEAYNGNTMKGKLP